MNYCFVFPQELTSPRLIKSHLPYRFLPTALHNGEAKVSPVSGWKVHMQHKGFQAINGGRANLGVRYVIAIFQSEHRGCSIRLIGPASVTVLILHNHLLLLGHQLTYNEL